MATQQIFFTAMPRGFTVSRDMAAPLPISVYVSPRLLDADRLDAFPDWLNWTQRLVDFGLSLKFSAAAGEVTLPVDVTGLRPPLWAALFNAETYVRSYTFDDYTGQAILSSPVRYALSMIKSIYGRAGVELALPDRTPPQRGEEHAGHHRRLIKELVADLAVNWDDRDAEQYRGVERNRFRDGDDLSRTFLPGWLGPDGLLIERPLDRNGEPLDPPPQFDAQYRDRLAKQAAVTSHIPAGKPLDENPPDFTTLIDFHQALSSLNSYPELLRQLGLVLDFELPAEIADLGGAPTGTLKVTDLPGAVWELPDTRVPPNPPSLGTSYVDTTNPADGSRYFFTTPENYGGPEDQVQTLGLLNLHPNRYGIAQVDVDGATHKLVMLAESWQDGKPEPAVSDHPEVFDESATLPALRSGGLSLFADGRARALLHRFEQSKVLNDALSGVGAGRDLVAEDLIHGYRLDVWDSTTSTWHSLHQRDAHFTMGDQEASVAGREGITQLAVTSAGKSPDNAQPDDLYLHEAIARWTGWSLSVPAAGKHLSSDPDPNTALSNPNENAPATPFKMTTKFTVLKGSLPSLRFGRRYRFRARVTDICGNSLGLTDPVADELSQSGFSLPVDADGFAYLRYEPVAAPIVVARDIAAINGPGSALHRLVIRTFNSDPSQDEVPAEVTANDRHLVPPRATVDLAEKLGMFDDPAAKIINSAAMHALIAARDSGQLATATSQVAGASKTYPLEAGESIDPVPYLPDVLSRGAALRDLPGTKNGTIGRLSAAADPGANLSYKKLCDPSPRRGSATLLDFGDGSDWQRMLPMRLALKGGSGPPTWDGATRELSVYLPRASSTLVPLSSYLRPDDLKLMGVWQWIREHIDILTANSPEEDLLPTDPYSDVDKIAHVLQRAVEGGHWMLTPPTILTLVHATQQPLGRPEFCAIAVQHEPYGHPELQPGDETHSPDAGVLQTQPEGAPTQATELDPITAWRKPGALDAYLLGGLKIHAASTDKVNLEAEWSDPIDDVSTPRVESDPNVMAHTAAVDEIPIHAFLGGMLVVHPETENERLVGFHDADHDLVCFVRAGDSLGNLLSSEPRGLQRFPLDAAPRHHLNDTLHHRVTYTAIATSKFRDYFPGDVDGGFTRASEPVVVDVPASARPKTPQISYVVPTFGWQRQAETNLQRSVRFGGGLRIYLERGWFSSGAGEMLGVVVYDRNHGVPVDYDAWKPYVTQWGADPIWTSQPMFEDVPGITNFPDGLISESSVSLDARGDRRADVVGYEVAFDEERQLWFADVTLNVNSWTYSPFVRLALCRYQPHAIPDAKISRVVLADFAQLTPSRAAVVTADPYHPRRLRVSVSGIAPSGPNAVAVNTDLPNPVSPPTVVSLEVQQRRDDVPGNLGWVDAAPGVAEVVDRTAEHPAPGLLLWTGTVDFAEPAEAGRYRLLICEHEYFSANHAQTRYDADGVPYQSNPRRLVYAESIQINENLIGGRSTSTGTIL